MHSFSIIIKLRISAMHSGIMQEKPCFFFFFFFFFFFKSVFRAYFALFYKKMANVSFI